MCRCGECFGCTLHILSTEHIFSQSDWREMLDAMRAMEYALIETDRKEFIRA